MARILSYRRVPELTRRFEILKTDPKTLIMDVLDRTTRCVYTVEAAGKVEYETMTKMDDARWATFSKTIEG